MKKIFFTTAIVVVALYSCGEETSASKSENTAPLTIKDGEQIFSKNCTMCHAFSKEESSGMAPVLDSVKYHWDSKEKLAAYIGNAKEHENDNEHTKAIFNQWKTSPQMPPFLGLSNDEKLVIAEYVLSMSK
jgi:cytochrome c2